MNKFTHANKAALALLLLLTLFCITLYIAPTLVYNKFSNDTLSEEYDFCQLENKNDSLISDKDFANCQWRKETLINLQKYRNKVNLFNKISVYKKRILLNETSKSNFLFIPNYFGVIDIFWNSKLVYSSESKSSAFPLFFQLMNHFNTENNELIIVLKPNESIPFPLIISGPVIFTNLKNSNILLQTVIAERIFLPLVSGFISLVILIISLFTFSFFKNFNTTEVKYVLLILFCSLSEFSLSRLPREYLRNDLLHILHFFFRMLLDFFILDFTYSLLEIKRNHIYRFIRLIVTLFSMVFISLFIVNISSLYFNELFTTIHKNDFIIYFSKYALAFSSIAYFTSFFYLLKKRKEYPEIFFLFIFILPMEVIDMLNLNRFFSNPSEHYFARFFLAIIAMFFGAALFKKIILIQQKKESLAKIGLMTEQLAHDIRSPLNALRVLQNLSKNIQNEEKEILDYSVNRIRGIADFILKISKISFSSNAEIPNEELIKVNLYQLISSSIQEKELEHKYKLSIQFTFSDNIKNTLVLIQINEFQRVFSNLVNNSVEACKNHCHLIITVSTESPNNSFIKVSIKDNGAGIPENLLNSIGKRGFSFNKTSGNGLGLFHAKNRIQSWGGKFKILSKINEGTEIIFELKTCT